MEHHPYCEGKYSEFMIPFCNRCKIIASAKWISKDGLNEQVE